MPTTPLDTSPSTPTTREAFQRKLDEFSETQRIASKLTGDPLVYCLGASGPSAAGNWTTWFQGVMQAKAVADANSWWVARFIVCCPHELEYVGLIDLFVEEVYAELRA